MVSRRLKEAYGKAECQGDDDCFDCDVFRLLVIGLVEARKLQPIDNAIVQDLEDAIDALDEWASKFTVLKKTA